MKRANSIDYTISCWGIPQAQTDRVAKTGAKPMRFMLQRSRIAIAVVIVFGAGAIAIARPHAVSGGFFGLLFKARFERCQKR
jgi:hypothetical protein